TILAPGQKAVARNQSRDGPRGTAIEPEDRQTARRVVDGNLPPVGRNDPVVGPAGIRDGARSPTRLGDDVQAFPPAFLGCREQDWAVGHEAGVLEHELADRDFPARARSRRSQSELVLRFGGAQNPLSVRREGRLLVEKLRKEPNSRRAV